MLDIKNNNKILNQVHIFGKANYELYREEELVLLWNHKNKKVRFQNSYFELLLSKQAINQKNCRSF